MKNRERNSNPTILGRGREKGKGQRQGKKMQSPEDFLRGGSQVEERKNRELRTETGIQGGVQAESEQLKTKPTGTRWVS